MTHFYISSKDVHGSVTLCDTTLMQSEFVLRLIVVCKQSNRLRRSILQVCKYQFTITAIRRWEIEHIESMFYTVTEIGNGEFKVERNGKSRIVKVCPQSEFGAQCSCLYQNDRRGKCRHIAATQRAFPEIGNAQNISDFFSSTNYVNSFTGYTVSMPTEEEIAAAGFGNFNAEVKFPHYKKGRGRPRVKRTIT